MSVPKVEGQHVLSMYVFFFFFDWWSIVKLRGLLGRSLGLLGLSLASLEAPWGALEASWTSLGPVLGHLGPLLGPRGALLGLLGALLGPLGALLDPLGTLLGPLGGVPNRLKNRSTHRSEIEPDPGWPKSLWIYACRRFREVGASPRLRSPQPPKLSNRLKI